MLRQQLEQVNNKQVCHYQPFLVFLRRSHLKFHNITNLNWKYLNFICSTQLHLTLCHSGASLVSHNTKPHSCVCINTQVYSNESFFCFFTQKHEGKESSPKKWLATTILWQLYGGNTFLGLLCCKCSKLLMSPLQETMAKLLLCLVHSHGVLVVAAHTYYTHPAWSLFTTLLHCTIHIMCIKNGPTVECKKHKQQLHLGLSWQNILGHGLCVCTKLPNLCRKIFFHTKCVDLSHWTGTIS